MAYFILRYEVVPDYLARRGEFREEHLGLARGARERGELMLAGATGDPPAGAILVFRATDKGVAEDFARADPYVINGLVEHWEVLPWAVVIE